MVCGLNDARVAQPDDALFAVTDFGAIMMLRLKFVRLCMTVNQRMWVIGVGLVQVLPRHDRGTNKPRHDGERDDGAPKPSRHDDLIMVRLECPFIASCVLSPRLSSIRSRDRRQSEAGS